MNGEKRSRAQLWIGLAAGFALGVVSTIGALVGMAVWAMHEVSKVYTASPHAGLPALDTTAASGRMSYAGWVEDLAGRRVELSGYRGRVVIVHRWATWCGPCVRELPEIQALADSLARDGIAVLAVSDEDPKKVHEFLAKRHLHLPVYVAREELPPEFRAQAIPATFVVGKDGRIAARQVGAAAWDSESTRRFIRGLL